MFSYRGSCRMYEQLILPDFELILLNINVGKYRNKIEKFQSIKASNYWK
jgi:hypothetical protein